MKTIIDKAILVLNNGGILLYPSDTVWGLACDASNKKAVQGIFEIKKRPLDKSVLIQIANLDLLTNYAFLSKNIEAVLKNFDEPITAIFPYKQGLADLVVAKDNTIAVRIPKDEFSKKLLAVFKKPIVSTSANLSGKLFPTVYDKIDKNILEQVDYIVPLRQEELMNQPSKIIKLSGDTIITIR